MLTIQQCRRLLGDSPDLADHDVAEYRATAWVIAEAIVDCFLRQVGSVQSERVRPDGPVAPSPNAAGCGR